MRMRTTRFVIWMAALCSAALLLLISPAVLSWIDQTFLTVFPTPDRQSAFYRSYEPSPILSPLITPQHPATGGEFSVGEGGKRAATLHREIIKVFAIQTKDVPALMTALSDDISQQLDRSGERLTGMSYNEANGLAFSYTERSGQGTVVLRPAEVVDASELSPLSVGEVPVRVRIVMDESWARGGT
jgi:hypothetical protein